MDKNKISILNKELNGEVRNDSLYKKLYATDASVYKKYPTAVAFPKTNSDIKKIISFCLKEKLSIIPRTAGTSLAGQCVGSGIIVDVSKHFNKIISLDNKNKTVTVQPGVIRDELNLFLKKHGLFFGPNTSTSNYCMIGGMVGNNSSGTTSIKYGVTREFSKGLPALRNKIAEDIEFQRFRGNLYIDGISAWEERNWINKTIKINISRSNGSNKRSGRNSRRLAYRVPPWRRRQKH